jgi:glycosyltransferase involved in cell wall biosynthesis
LFEVQSSEGNEKAKAVIMKNKRQAATGVSVIIPAYNEAASIAKVIAEIPVGFADDVVVVDNNSTDSTSEEARKAGAFVLKEHRQGYGHACLKGIEYLRSKTCSPAIVIFLDADYADYPEEITNLIKPIIERDYDLVIGSRTLGEKMKGAMKPWQTSGNRLITFLIRALYKTSFTDLGPFRAIKFDRLLALNMKEKTYGWSVEMQIKAVKQGLRILEIPVKYRARIGKSKISGTFKGSLLAGYRMAAVTLKLR